MSIIHHFSSHEIHIRLQSTVWQKMDCPDIALLTPKEWQLELLLHIERRHQSQRMNYKYSFHYSFSKNIKGKKEKRIATTRWGNKLEEWATILSLKRRVIILPHGILPFSFLSVLFILSHKYTPQKMEDKRCEGENIFIFLIQFSVGLVIFKCIGKIQIRRFFIR